MQPEKPPQNKIQLSFVMTPNSKTNIVNIKLAVYNPTNDVYSSDDYFYRIVLGRSYPISPGFVIKEFSKKLDPQSGFDMDIPWNEVYLQDESVKVYVHFNMYKRNEFKDSTLVSTITHPLYINLDPPFNSLK